MSSSRDLLSFKAITGFVEQLTDLYGDKHRPLKLYNKLLQYVKVSDSEHISKHVETFRRFCEANDDAIETKDRTKLKESTITFSAKVFINIDYILSLADEDTADIIWSHILTITASVCPTSKAKQILLAQKTRETLNSGSGEGDWLKNVITKMEGAVESGEEALSPQMFTEVFESLNKGMEEGSINIGGIIGSLQGLISTVTNSEDGEGLDLNQLVSSISNMASEGGVGEGGFDLNKIISSISGGKGGSIKPPSRETAAEVKVAEITEVSSEALD